MTNRIQVRGNHYVLLGANGDELMTSKEYADEAGARRSATNLYNNLISAELTLEVAESTKVGKGKSSQQKWTKTEVLSETVAYEGDEPLRQGDPLPQKRSRGPIRVPEPGKSAHALNPYAQ